MDTRIHKQERTWWNIMLIPSVRSSWSFFSHNQLGSNLSIQFPEGQCPLIIFGHDECIFKQFTMSTKSWVGPNGKTVIVPKDDRLSAMITAFQSWEFGFGLELSNEQLQEVNATHVGKMYLDEKAATAVKATTSKPALTKSPFIREFEYGSSGEGYWTYQHMVLQLEDCVDVLKAIFLMYAFLFLFDHSCRHEK